MTEPRVHMRHVRQLMGTRITCAPNIRLWCAMHDIDLREFTRDGVAGERLAAIGGHFAMTVLEIARKDVANG